MTSIGIIGVGAIGGSLSGFMALNDEDVTFIDPWRENVEAMRQGGLLLDGSVEGRVTDMAVYHTDELDRIPKDKKFDILIVAVKSYDTRWATTSILPFITDETWVVSPQNGINELQIGPIVGAKRTIGCVTTISAGMMEPAHITRTDSMAQALQTEPICFTVGELDRQVTERVERLAKLFGPAGRTVVTEDLWGERWTKLSTNCMANPISAMTGMPSYDMRAHDEARVTMSVCTGSALLAKAGLLDGLRATSNKQFFGLSVQQSDNVDWVEAARWVDAGSMVTSSGVSAGIDMALAVIERLFSADEADRICALTEYQRHTDADSDPFVQYLNQFMPDAN